LHKCGAQQALVAEVQSMPLLHIIDVAHVLHCLRQYALESRLASPFSR
jgi:hypothetical protein